MIRHQRERHPMKYRALFDVKQFAGYSLWWVRVRGKPKQRWADATLHAGRTDTEFQAWGQVAGVLAGIDLSGVRDGAGQEKWSMIRDHIRRGWPGEPQRLAGALAWIKWSGDRAALADVGREFRDAWRAECQRREDAKPRFTFEEQMDALAWQAWCCSTGRRDHRRSPTEDLTEFLKWKAEKLGRAGDDRRWRQCHDDHSFDFLFAPARADDLAVLGLPVTATAGDIKTAWRRLAMRHHPDRGGDHGEFVRLKSAYKRLSGGAA